MKPVRLDADDQRLLRNLKRRIARARRFPTNTDPYVRHVQTIGEYLAAGRTYHMIGDEPLHVAVSLLTTVEALYKLRNILAKKEAGP